MEGGYFVRRLSWSSGNICSWARRERLYRWGGSAEEVHQEGEGSGHPVWSSWWGVREETRFLGEVTMY